LDTLSEFENLTKKKKEEDKEEKVEKKPNQPTFEDNWSDQMPLEIPKLDYETLRHQVEHSLRVGKDMNYGNYNIAGLVLSDLKLYIEKNSGKHEVSTEMRKFAEEYSVWLISNGQKYINALSPDFTTENHMDIFIRDYYGKNWMKK